jgi:hypothetical protein
MRSFAAQFVSAVLALGTNVARPSTALMPDAAFTGECRLRWSAREDLNLSDAHLLSGCVLKYSAVRSKEQAAAASAKSVSDLVRDWKPWPCVDLLAADYFETDFAAVYMVTLVQALPETGSCAHGCPLSRPLCNGALGCVQPTCADFKPLCNDKTGAGALARLLCSVTCGCGDLASELLWIGPDSGCLPACQEKAAKAETATCSDAQPGSAELAALVGYSRAFEPQFPGWFKTNATVRAELGCFALNFEADTRTQMRHDLCNQEFWNATEEAKSLVLFCPVSCGCLDDPSKPGCPTACSAPEPPTLRDLSDAQLAVATAARATHNEFNAPPYPPSCSDLNATVCEALLTAWYQHPCPVACGIDPDAASTSPGPHQPTTCTA